MRQLTRDHLKGKKPLQRTIVIPADEADAEIISDAENEYQRDLLLEKDPEESKARLLAVRNEVADRGSVFVFRGVGRRRFEELVRENPPTKAQKEDDDDAAWDPAAFWPALCSESCANTDLTPDEWTALIFDSSDWGAGEIKTLRDSALSVNTGTRVAELGN